MKKLKKIAGINIMIIIIFSVLAQLYMYIDGYGGEHAGLGLVVTSLAFLLAQGGINLLASIYFFLKDNSELGKIYLLSSVIVFVVGMSSCFGNIILTESLSILHYSINLPGFG
jgi:hypothetical protein